MSVRNWLRMYKKFLRSEQGDKNLFLFSVMADLIRHLILNNSNVENDIPCEITISDSVPRWSAMGTGIATARIMPNLLVHGTSDDWGV